MDSLNAFLRQPRIFEDKLHELTTKLKEFVSARKDLRSNDIAVAQSADCKLECCLGSEDMTCILHCFKQSVSGNVPVDVDAMVAILRTLKVLFRLEANRKAAGKSCVNDIVRTMKTPKSAAIAVEAANVVLNLCFGEGFVDLFVDFGGTQILGKFLGMSNKDMCASASGALQKICYEDRGRMACIENGVVSALVALLDLESDEKRCCRGNRCAAQHI